MYCIRRNFRHLLSLVKSLSHEFFVLHYRLRSGKLLGKKTFADQYIGSEHFAVHNKVCGENFYGWLSNRKLIKIFSLKSFPLYGVQNYCWGEPERAPHKRYSYAQIVYIYIYILSWYIGHTKYMPSMALYMYISAKYSIVHSHVWATDCIIRRSNLTNFKFTLVLIYRTVPYRSKGSKVLEERARQSSSSA